MGQDCGTRRRGEWTARTKVASEAVRVWFGEEGLAQTEDPFDRGTELRFHVSGSRERERSTARRRPRRWPRHREAREHFGGRDAEIALQRRADAAELGLEDRGRGHREEGERGDRGHVQGVGRADQEPGPRIPNWGADGAQTFITRPNRITVSRPRHAARRSGRGRCNAHQFPSRFPSNAAEPGFRANSVANAWISSECASAPAPPE